MSRFQPCPSCARHVRSEDLSCPFCQAAMPTPSPTSAPGGASVATAAPRVRMSRIAVLAAGATLMGAAASCDSAGKSADAGSGGQTMTGSGGAGGGATGGANGLPDAGTGGSTNSDAAQEAPVAIYAAAVAVVRPNQA